MKVAAHPRLPYDVSNQSRTIGMVIKKIVKMSCTAKEDENWRRLGAIGRAWVLFQGYSVSQAKPTPVVLAEPEERAQSSFAWGASDGVSLNESPILGRRRATGACSKTANRRLQLLGPS